MKRLFLLVFVLASGLGADAQVAYTEARGFYTMKVPGAPEPGATSRTYLGIQLLRATAYAGMLSGVDGNNAVLEDFATQDFRALADPVRPSYLHVMNGHGRGFVTDIEEFLEDGVVCAEDPGPWMGAGTQVRIRPHSNLSDIFGADNRYGFEAGPDSGHADNVVVWDAAAQQERVYYFHETRNRWEEQGIPVDAGTASIRFPHGCYLVRRSTGMLRIALSGDEIASHAVLLPVRPGVQVFSLPVNLTGSPDAIVRTTGEFAVKSGPNARSADVLVFEEPTTGQQRGPFYHMRRADTSGWREVGVDGSDVAEQPLDFLSTLVFHRRGAAGWVLAEGSLDPPPVPRPTLPPDAEPDELPLMGEWQLPAAFPEGVTVTIETSTDLANWTVHATPEITEDNRAVFPLPPGQGRAFYRVAVELNFE